MANALNSVGADRTARVWIGMNETPVVLQGHESEIVWADFTPDGVLLVTRGADGTVHDNERALLDFVREERGKLPDYLEKLTVAA